MSEASTPEESADRGSKTAETPTVRGWHKRVAAAGLPAETAALVAATVKATKLRRPEKLAVADELIAHFHDADRQGVTPEAARADFGDPAVAATLIRRAKKRNRGILSRAWTAAKWCFLGFVVFYAALALRFYSGEPEVKVDYLAKFNATAAAVPEGERAWPEIRDTLAGMGFVGGRRPIDPGLQPGDAEWPSLVRFLSDHSGGLRGLRGAAEHAGLGPTAVIPAGAAPSDALLFQSEAWMAHFTLLRSAVRLLSADAIVAAERGDATTVTEDLRSILAFGSFAREQPSVIAGLVAISIHHLGVECLAKVLSNHPNLLGPEALSELQRTASESSGITAADLLGERYLFEDLLQRMYTDDGRGGGRLTSEALFSGWGPQASPFGGPVTPDLKELALLQKAVAPASLAVSPGRAALARVYIDWINQVAEDLDRPLSLGWQPAGDAVAKEVEERPLGTLRFGFVANSLSGLGSLRETNARFSLSQGGTVLALALHRHRLATGAFPDSATGYAELVPAYLDAIPPDPLHGTPMRWTLRDEQPVIYSLGADGDDDGGVPPVDAQGEPDNDAAFAPPENAVDGDWIAWPPDA